MAAQPRYFILTMPVKPVSRHCDVKTSGIHANVLNITLQLRYPITVSLILG